MSIIENAPVEAQTLYRLTGVTRTYQSKGRAVTPLIGPMIGHRRPVRPARREDSR